MDRSCRGARFRRRARLGVVLGLAALGLGGCEKTVVNVIPVAALTVTPSQVTMLEGENRTLQAAVRGPDNETLQGRTLSWSANPTGVVSLTQAGLITAVAPGATTVSVETEGVSVSVPVTVLQGPTLALSTNALALAAPSGQTAAVVRTVNVSNTGNGSLQALGRSVVMSSGAGAGWLTASLSGTSAPAQLTITASAANLPAGSYKGTVTVTDPAARNGAQTVSVDFEVGQALPAIVVNPTSAQFAANAGTVQAATQDITVTNGGGGTVGGLVATVSPGAPWLTAAFTGGTTAPTTLELSASAAALGTGVYAATVTLTSTSGANPVTIQVTFQVN